MTHTDALVRAFADGSEQADVEDGQALARELLAARERIAELERERDQAERRLAELTRASFAAEMQMRDGPARAALHAVLARQARESATPELAPVPAGDQRLREAAQALVQAAMIDRGSSDPGGRYALCPERVTFSLMNALREALAATPEHAPAGGDDLAERELCDERRARLSVELERDQLKAELAAARAVIDAQKACIGRAIEEMEAG